MEEKHTCPFFLLKVTKKTETKEALPRKTNKNTEDNICHGFLTNFSLMAMMQQIVTTSLQHKHPYLSFLIYCKIQRKKKVSELSTTLKPDIIGSLFKLHHLMFYSMSYELQIAVPNHHASDVVPLLAGTHPPQLLNLDEIAAQNAITRLCLMR